MKETYLICMNVVVLVVMIGITACDRDNLNNQDNITGTDQLEASSSESSANLLSASGSSSFSVEITSSGSDISTKAKSPGSTDHLLLNGETSDPLNVTGNLQITTGTANPTSNLQRVNPIYRTYQNVPDNISYDGNSELNYTIDGTSYSTSLTSDQQTILDDLQQELIEARTYGEDPPSPPEPCPQQVDPNVVCPEEKSISAMLANGHSIKTMSDQQIKQWLQEQGYEVKAIGNHEYEVTRTYNKEEFGRNMSITSVFDAKTGKMKPNYSVSKDGNQTSHQLPESVSKGN